MIFQIGSTSFELMHVNTVEIYTVGTKPCRAQNVGPKISMWASKTYSVRSPDGTWIFKFICSPVHKLNFYCHDNCVL